MYRSVVRMVTLCLFGFAALAVTSAHATSTLWKRECNGCHSAPPTCNGCHAHGTHKITGDNAALNLVATTDKTEYVAGDDITVTLSGGNLPPSGTGWVGVKLYDDKGVKLAYVKSELPATLTARAYAGTTMLYMSWIGYDYDSEGGFYGSPIGDNFAAGMRLSSLEGVHHNERHIEEVVATNRFSVSESEATSSGDRMLTDSASKSNSGIGSFDLSWILAAGLFAALRRRGNT